MNTLHLYIGSANRGGPLFEVGWLQIEIETLENMDVFDRCTIQRSSDEAIVCRVWKKWKRLDGATKRAEHCRLVIPEDIWDTMTKN